MPRYIFCLTQLRWLLMEILLCTWRLDSSCHWTVVCHCRSLIIGCWFPSLSFLNWGLFQAFNWSGSSGARQRLGYCEHGSQFCSYLPPQFIRLRILNEEYHLFHEPQVNLGKKNTFNVNHYLGYKNPLMLITTSSMSVSLGQVWYWHLLSTLSDWIFTAAFRGGSYHSPYFTSEKMRPREVK